MNISELFIRRPVTTTLVMAGHPRLRRHGATALLPVCDLPNVDFPTIQVAAALPGATPETMASSVATPLEKQFSTIAGLDTINSTSIAGRTQITLQFDLSRNIDARRAGRAVDDLAHAARQLPPQMPTPPSYQKVNPADQPVLFLALTLGDAAALARSTSTRETMMAQRISMVTGVAQVQVYGPQKYAVRVAARSAPARRAAASASTRSRRPSSNANVNLPTGTIYGADDDVHRAGQRPAHRRGRVRADHRRVPQRHAGAPRRGRRTSTTASRTTRPPPGTTASARSRSRSSSSPARTRSQVVDAVRGAAADVPGAAAGVGRRSTSATTARRRSASRSPTSSSRCS